MKLFILIKIKILLWSTLLSNIKLNKTFAVLSKLQKWDDIARFFVDIDVLLQSSKRRLMSKVAGFYLGEEGFFNVLGTQAGFYSHKRDIIKM